MKVLAVGLNYSLHLDSDLKPYIHTDIYISDPAAAIHTNVVDGYAGWVNTMFAIIDNKVTVDGSVSVTISTQSNSRQRMPGFLKVLHVNEKGFLDKDKDIIVYMSLTEHHDTQNYPAYFPENAVTNMLGIRRDDVVTLGYVGDEAYIHFIAFVMRDQHRTQEMLGAGLFLLNDSGKLRIV